MTSWEQLGLWGGAHESLPSSAETFPDAAQYRIEIPSTEGPECLAAVLDEADKLWRDRAPRVAGHGRFPAHGPRAR